MTDQKPILSEIRAFHKKSKSGVAGDRHDPPGKQMMDSLSRCLPQEAEQHQLDILRNEMQARLVALHSPAESNAMGVPKPRQFQLPPARKAKLQADFTHSFNFREREFRESAIPSPYDTTFLWMFQCSDQARSNTGFRQWLASSSNLYWITGKPGAGKSTLMKYISSFRSNGEGAKICRRFLVEGAGSSKIATASFYFWASGAEIQASQTALFRTLLFDLLQDPLRDPTRADLITRIAPAMWESACLLGTPFPSYWDEGELGDLLFRTIQELSRENTRVCMFIDGLDEFAGEPQTIISWVKKILKLPNVKLCVSSRPWVPFECAFGRAPSLRVQDLTYPDIHHFVKSRFDECEDFSRLMRRETAYAAKLIDQVVEKSAGVFLWVRIVVDSLITGLSNHDKTVDLERRLDALPPEIDNLYGKILDDIDPFYSARASQYFQLLLANDGSAEALLLSFADEDKGFCLTLPSAIMSRGEHSTRIETLGRRLSSSCKGLLEIGSDGRVTFLHRTLRDFLVRPENQERLGNATRESDFDGHLQLCSAFYCLMKAVAFSTWANSSTGDPTGTDHLTEAFQTPNSTAKQDYERGETAVIQWFAECLKRASRVTVGNHEMINILDCLDNDLKGLRRLRRRLSNNVARRTDSSVDQHGWLFMEEDTFGTGMLITYDDLLPFATRFGVAHYVRAKAKSQATYRRTHSSAAVSTWTRLINFVIAYPISAHRDRQGCYHRSLFLNACLVDPPSLGTFQALLSHYGAAGTPRSALLRPSVFPTTHASSRYHSIGLSGLSVVEVIVCVALLSSLVHEDEYAASQAWGQWVPVLQLLAAAFGQTLDLRSAKAVTKRYKHLPYGAHGLRQDWTKTALTPEDLVKVLEIDSPDSNCIGNWRTILEKTDPSRTTARTH